MRHEHYEAGTGRLLWVKELPDPPLASVKAELKQQIDDEAEVARLRHITAGSGQAMEYIEVAKEARNYALDPLPQPTEYPMLWASVEAGEAADLAGAVDLIRQREAAGVIIGADIRKKRIAAKRAVTAATTVEEARAAAQIVW